MRVKRITVGNFKNIALTTLDCTKMIALISPNNYGKSNLMEAIRFGLNFISVSSRVRSNRMRMVSCIPLSPELANQEFVFAVEFDDPDLGEYRFVRYSYKFSWLNDQNTGAKITDENIEIRPTESVKYTSYLKRKEGKYRPGKTSSAMRKLALGSDALAIDAIELIEDVEIASAIKSLRSIGCQICDSLELNDSFNSLPIEFDFGENITLGNEDIPRTLAMLKTKRPDLYDLYIETIYDLFPEFTQIELQKLAVQNDIASTLEKAIGSPNEEKDSQIPYHVRDDVYRLIIHSKYLNQPISMEYMSAGTKRVFWLVINAVVAEYRHTLILGVEEIEASIHPRMIKNLLESLNDTLENTFMILTSHSPYLIQYLKPDSIYVGFPNERGIASFRRINHRKIKSLISTTRKMEMSIGEYLFELMSGDHDAAGILSSYLEEN